MYKQQQAVVIGSLLGDSFLQKTGKNNARLRLEHSLKQKEYLLWKCKILSNFFQNKPVILERKNSVFGKTYQYIRNQSYSGLELGKLHKLFYKDNVKVIPNNISKLMTDPLSIAVWFMDDGYYYQRDKIAYIYLPKYDAESITNLLDVLKNNFNLVPVLRIKKRGEYVFTFSVEQTQNLMKLIKPFIIASMQYKLSLDPVSTDPSSKQ